MYNLHLTHSWRGGSTYVQCVMHINPINGRVLCNDSLHAVAGKSSPVKMVTFLKKKKIELPPCGCLPLCTNQAAAVQ